jgi:hypothetical protein
MAFLRDVLVWSCILAVKPVDWKLKNQFRTVSVYRSQVDIKRKICDIRTWKKHLFLDISFTNIDTLVPSLYQFVETRSIGIFWLLSQSLLFQPLYHQQNVFHPVVNRFTWQILPTINRKHYFMNIRCIGLFYPTKVHNRMLLFDSTLVKHGCHFDY